jgi:regulator of sirC expression with transglutaminase-like and TPR domain
VLGRLLERLGDGAVERRRRGDVDLTGHHEANGRAVPLEPHTIAAVHRGGVSHRGNMGAVDAPASRFAELLAGPDESLPLDEAALLIAAHADRSVDVDVQLQRLDRLAAEVPAPTLDGLRALLFRDLGFRGNRADYYDPRNSLLPHVLDRRTGIPIALAVLMMEVGRRIGVPMWGVSMPGHFLVRDKVDTSVFVDPFHAGAVLDRDGCERLFLAVQPPGSVFDEAFLQPVPRAAIVARMLANLAAVAEARGDRDMLRWVLQLKVAVPGASDGERRRLAVLQAELN